jgi:hypothetical protein
LPPVLVTSFPEFTQLFCGYFTPNFSDAVAPATPPWPYNLLPHAVAGFFNNGGQLLYIKRIAASTLPPYTLAPVVVVVNGSSPNKSYQVGDVLTVTGGTTSNPANPADSATIQVTAISSALASALLGIAAPTAGSYLPGDVLAVTGGTFTVPATIQVTTVTAAGAIDTWTILNAGSYSVNPPSPNTLGLGSLSHLSGATFTLTMSPAAIVSAEVANAGSYSAIPPLTPNTPGAGTLSTATGASFNLTMFPTPPAPATSSEGVQNSLPSPQIVTRLTSTAYKNSLTLQLQSLRGIQNGSVLLLQNGPTTVATATVSSYVDANGTVTLASPLTNTFDAQSTTVSVSSGGAFTVTGASFLLSAADPGAWGNTVQVGTQATPPLQVQIQPSSRAMAQVLAINNLAPLANNLLVVSSASNFYAGAIVEFNTMTQKFYAKILSITGNSIQLTAALPVVPTTLPFWVRSCEFDVFASYGSVSESFRGLTLDDTTPYFYATTINNGSALLAVQPVSPANPTHPYPFYDDTTTNPSTMPMGIDGLNVPMAGGTDGGTPSANDYIGTDGGPGNRTGLAALIDVDEISIIGAPGVIDQATQAALITQCETLLYRFAILDPAPIVPSNPSNLSAIQSQRLMFDTKYAAIYFPSLILDDPLTGNNLIVPPSGHMAGIYAQTDDSRGVWKAPANVVINGILDLEIKLSKGDQDILNPEPNNINALRDFTAQGRGLRVYGARCITSDVEWMYINVRRLFIFLEASLDQGTQWAVFEPNDQQLWNRLIQSVSSFLTTVWREGGLMGTTADQAFFVKCGYDTMSSDDIENGRLIMLVGVAPVFPAEFVIIRIGQWAGGSSVQEV